MKGLLPLLCFLGFGCAWAQPPGPPASTNNIENTVPPGPPAANENTDHSVPPGPPIIINNGNNGTPPGPPQPNSNTDNRTPPGPPLPNGGTGGGTPPGPPVLGSTGDNGSPPGPPKPVCTPEWTGLVNNRWEEPKNWSCFTVPDSTQDVSIPDVSPKPFPLIEKEDTVFCRTLQIATRASLSFENKGMLHLYGDWINKGEFLPNQGHVLIHSSKGVIRKGGSSSTEHFYQLTVSPKASIVLDSEIEVQILPNGGLNVEGTLDLAHRPVRLRSVPPFNDTGHWIDSTARLGRVTGLLLHSEKFSIERAIAATSIKPRFLAIGVTNMPAQQWADSVSIFGGSATTGFRPYSGLSNTFSTLWRYEESTPSGNINKGFRAITDASNVLIPGKGYRLYVGYDALAEYAPPRPIRNVVTLRMTGSPVAGDFEIPITKSGADPYGWNLVGNPYPCEIDWDSVWAENKQNVSSTIAIADPLAPSSGGSPYYYYNAYTGDAIDSRSPTSSRYGKSIIASSQAFFVFKTSSLAPNALHFQERMKPRTHVRSEGNFRLQDPYSTLRITLKSAEHSDQCILYLKEEMQDSLFQPMYDAYKLPNPVLSIATHSHLGDMALHTTDLPTTTKTIPLRFFSTLKGTHSLQLNGSTDMQSSHLLYLKDQFLHQTTLVTEGIPVVFEVSEDSGSFAPERFYLEFRPFSTFLDPSDKYSFVVYPNPYRKGNLFLSSFPEPLLKAEVSNAQGNRYDIRFLQQASSPIVLPLDEHELAAGVYMIRLSSEHYVKTIQLICTP